MRKIRERAEYLVNSYEDEDQWIILIWGNRIKVPSGKSSWTSIGAAKNALRNAFSWCIRQEGEGAYQKFLSDSVQFLKAEAGDES